MLPISWNQRPRRGYVSGNTRAAASCTVTMSGTPLGGGTASDGVHEVDPPQRAMEQSERRGADMFQVS